MSDRECYYCDTQLGTRRIAEVYYNNGEEEGYLIVRTCPKCNWKWRCYVGRGDDYDLDGDGKRVKPKSQRFDQ